MLNLLNLTFEKFAKKYCERQEQTPEGLKEVLSNQAARYKPDGWVLLQCVVMDSSRIGELVIVPYGPENTWKEIPTGTVSPRGSCADISEVVAVLTREEFNNVNR